MPDKQHFEVRDMRDGDWCWIHKAVIRGYTRKVGAIGIAVYGFLASLSDSHQACFPSQRYIAETLGYSRSYVNKVLKALAMHRLIWIERRGRHSKVYHLLKVRCQPEETQVSTIANSGVCQSDTNDNRLTKSINNIDSEDKEPLSRTEGFKPGSREELLASDIADALNDRKSLPLYLSYARRFPESFLRRVLGEIKEIPQERIRKSRAALFNHIIRRYAQGHKNHRD